MNTVEIISSIVFILFDLWIALLLGLVAKKWRIYPLYCLSMLILGVFGVSVFVCLFDVIEIKVYAYAYFVFLFFAYIVHRNRGKIIKIIKRLLS